MAPGAKRSCWRSGGVAVAIALLGAGLEVAAVRAAAPGVWELGEPARKVFVESRDLPHSTVHALLVARDGRLWAGTQDGAAVYDGTGWTTLDLPTRSLSNFVRSIAESADGALWFGTQSAGLARFQGGEWTLYRRAEGALPDDRVNVLLERVGARGPELWIGTHDGGLARLAGGRFERFGADAGLPSPRIWDLLELRGSVRPELWVATGDGVARFVEEEGRFEASAGLPAISASSLAERIDSSGLAELWVGTYGEGVWRLVRGRWERVETGGSVEGRFVTDLAPAGELGEVWIASDGGGVVRWSDRGVERLEAGEALTSGAVYKVLETRADEGAHAVWLGTRNQGLIRVSPGYWRSISTPGAGPRIAITALEFERTAGGGEALWLGTDGRGAWRFHEGRWSRHDVASGALGNDSVLALAAGAMPGGGSEVWVGTRNGGISRWDGERWRRYDVAGGDLANDLVQALLRTGSSAGGWTLWAGSRGGLARYRDGRWRHGSEGEGGPVESVVALAETTGEGGEAELWVGTTGGLYRQTRNGWSHYGEAEGLLNPTVHALHPRRDAQGRLDLWLGTDGGGAYRLRLDDPGAGLERLEDLIDQRLASQVVYAFADDAAGRLYFSTNHGVYRLTEAGSRFTAERFEDFHGLPSDQGNRGAARTDSAGRVWFGTVRGAAALDPAQEVSDQTKKRLLVSGRDLYGGSGAIRDGARLPPGRGRVGFEYRLLSYFGEERTRYRTRLAGFEPAFGDWTPANEREYTSLPPGAYSFEVMGRDAAGNLSGPVVLRFTVEPALWQTAWGRWGALLALVGLLASAWGVRTAALRRRETELQALIAARTRQLESANAILIDLSYLDPLTSIPNRRRFDQVLADEWRRADRARQRLSLIMIDVDFFKAFNDTYGHQAGDDCLRRVAATLSDYLPRAGDAVARYGGEEFAVLLPGTDAAGAYLLAERLRQQIARLGIPHRASGVSSFVTVSCGVATRRPQGDDAPAQLVAAADVALYAAKGAGRNRSTLEE